MKNIFLLSFIISFPLLAKDTCYLYEAKGVVQIKDKQIQLIVNKDTMSEYIFTVSEKDEHKLAPYLDTTTLGTYLFKRKPQSKDSIKAVKSISRSMPDPINHMKNSYIKELKVSSCR